MPFYGSVDDDEGQDIARGIAEVWRLDPESIDATLMEWLDGRWGVRVRPKVYDAALRSDHWSPTHLMALGRIVELSAQLERLMRVALMVALEVMPGSEDVDVVTTGMRFGEMQRLLHRLSAAAAAGTKKRARRKAVWLPTFLAWSTQAGHLIDERDSVLHRPPMILYAAGDHEPKYSSGMGRSRKAHVVEAVDERAFIELVERMEDGYAAGWDILFGEAIVEGGVAHRYSEAKFGRLPGGPDLPSTR